MDEQDGDGTPMDQALMSGGGGKPRSQALMSVINHKLQKFPEMMDGLEEILMIRVEAASPEARLEAFFRQSGIDNVRWCQSWRASKRALHGTGIAATQSGRAGLICVELALLGYPPSPCTVRDIYQLLETFNCFSFSVKNSLIAITPSE
ncbi:hypothetical protein J6590_031832 [Homalodisca vitripennis]|nr:hypothetical protein J6590_031832 [Homalodisca vitripennis]